MKLYFKGNVEIYTVKWMIQLASSQSALANKLKKISPKNSDIVTIITNFFFGLYCCIAYRHYQWTCELYNNSFSLLFFSMYKVKEIKFQNAS